MANTKNTIQDDLSKVKGIGAKYVEILEEAGVDTYEKLAALTEDELDTIIEASDARRPANLNTWTAQAQEFATDRTREVAEKVEEVTGMDIEEQSVELRNRFEKATGLDVEELRAQEAARGERLNDAFQQFVEHESKAFEAGRESLLSWLPEDVRKHGTDAVNEFIAGYRALLSPVLPKKDGNKNKIEIR
ncbi:MAG: helix-hairpin-helix domain-containing protein [Aggregatilineales bacterium]